MHVNVLWTEYYATRTAEEALTVLDDKSQIICTIVFFFLPAFGLSRVITGNW